MGLNTAGRGEQQQDNATGAPASTDGTGAGPLLLSVPEALAGERVDRALSLLAGVSRASASRMVAEGRVRVGGSTVSTGGRRLRAGDWLEVGPALHTPAEGQLQGQSSARLRRRQRPRSSSSTRIS